MAERILAGTEVTPYGPRPGDEIEVVIRYRGQEYHAANGIVEQVSVNTDFNNVYVYGDGGGRWIPGGEVRKHLSITVRQRTDVTYGEGRATDGPEH